MVGCETKIQINDLVCARMTSYKPWPARIVNLYKNSKGMDAAWVEFFGNLQVGEVLAANCIPFFMCNELIISYCKGKQKKKLI